jgi:hypothetical protein
VDGASQTDGERGMSAPEMAQAADFAGLLPCSDAAPHPRSQHE